MKKSIIIILTALMSLGYHQNASSQSIELDFMPMVGNEVILLLADDTRDDDAGLFTDLVEGNTAVVGAGGRVGLTTILFNPHDKFSFGVNTHLVIGANTNNWYYANNDNPTPDKINLIFSLPIYATANVGTMNSSKWLSSSGLGIGAGFNIGTQYVPMYSDINRFEGYDSTTGVGMYYEFRYSYIYYNLIGALTTNKNNRAIHFGLSYNFGNW